MQKFSAKLLPKLFILTLASMSFTFSAFGQNLPANLFVELAKKASPAVVNISTETLPKQMNPQFADPLQMFLEQFMGQGFKNLPQRPLKSLGTGFIISEDGIILTNNHVIEKADVIKVQIGSNKDEIFEAVVLGKDQRTDVGLIKIKTKKKLPILPLGDSDMAQVGEWVAAIGNPFGYGGTVTKGIISALGRDIPELNKFPFIQTDASINQGNSGGPLLNAKGEVIGINTAIDARAQNIGFAIPINDVKSILNQLKSNGRVSRGYMGVALQPVTMEIAHTIGLEKAEGALVAHVEDNSPARKANIQETDVILKVNNKKVKSTREVSYAIADTPVGKSIPLEIWRNGKKKTLKMTVGQHPEDAKLNIATKSSKTPKHKQDQSGIKAPHNFGFKVSNINQTRYKKRNSDGYEVVITSVSPGSPASSSGLMAGDIIYQIDYKTIKNISHFNTAMKAKTNKHLLRIRRGDTWFFKVLKSK